MNGASLRSVFGFWLSAAVMAGTITPASSIRIGDEDRSTFKEYSKQLGISLEALQTLFGATLRIVCPWTEGGAALVSTNGIFLTANHIFFEKRAQKNPFSKCYAEPLFGNKKFNIDPFNYVSGPDFRGHVSPAEQDIFIGRILNDDIGIQPYEIGSANNLPGQNVVSVSQGQKNWKGKKHKTPSIGQCTVMTTSVLSVYTDCDSDKGSSGASLLRSPIDPGQTPALIGIGVWTYYGDDGPYTNKDCDDTTKCATQHLRINAAIVGQVGELSEKIERIRTYQPLVESEIRERGKEYAKIVQRYLKSKGYYAGSIDGVYGRGSRRALVRCIVESNCQTGIPE